MYIDVHVHCRDWNQSNVATIKDVMKLARKYDFAAIGDMPNTIPKINTLELAYKRVRTARDESCVSGYYFHMGIDADPGQIREAVKAVNEIPECIGIKMYTCESTNDSGIKGPAQLMVYRELIDNSYDGVLTIHCELQDIFNPNQWNPKKPYTWNKVRPEISETVAVETQIGLYQVFQPPFSLHITHVSSPNTLKVIKEAKEHGVKITCGATPHHLLYSTKVMRNEDGSKFKVNPPLRDEDSVRELRSLLDVVDIIETDHAPHDKLKKRGIGCEAAPSGIQSLHLYPLLIEKMPEWGIEEKRIHELTYKNPKKIFPKIEVRV